MYTDMICDVMPPILEDNGSNNTHQEGIQANNDQEAQDNIEQLMVSILEERDKVKKRKTE